MSENLTPVYDSVFKKYQTTRRRIFKDSNGKYKEKLEIKNSEKRTLFGSLPFEANSNWKLEELSDIDYDDQKISHCHKHQTNATGKKVDNGAASNDLYLKNEESLGKPYDSSHVDPETLIKSHIKETIKTRFSELKTESHRDIQGVKTIFEKKRNNSNYGYNGSAGSTDETNFTN